MPGVYIKTYGCQMNERDSEQVARSLLARGFNLVAQENEADVILLNTCSVRDMAEQKAIGKMGMLQRLRENRPHLVFGYLGCMAQSRGAELLQTSPGVDLVAGTQKFHRVAEYVEELLQRRMNTLMDDPRLPIVDVGEEAGSQSTIRDHLAKAAQASAFVSIMQGCNRHCAFCIVPQTRGAERGRTIADIVEEVRGLAGRGVKEVTLLGQIVNLYGRHEFEKRDGLSPFVQLLEAVSAVEGIARLRFTSPHPIGFRDDLIAAFARLPTLAEHVHFPLQSGSNRILKIMRRGYTVEKYLDLVDRLSAARPGIARPLTMTKPRIMQYQKRLITMRASLQNRETAPVREAVSWTQIILSGEPARVEPKRSTVVITSSPPELSESRKPDASRKATACFPGVWATVLIPAGRILIHTIPRNGERKTMGCRRVCVVAAVPSSVAEFPSTRLTTAR